MVSVFFAMTATTHANDSLLLRDSQLKIPVAASSSASSSCVRFVLMMIGIELKKMFVGRIKDDSVLQLKIGDKL
jgi:hypothetical protein